MDWQQMILMWLHVFPLTLLLTALFMALLVGIPLWNRFGRGVFCVTFSLAALLAIAFVYWQSRAVESSDLPLLLAVTWKFQVFHVDALSLMWLPLTTLLVLVFLFWPQLQGTSPGTTRREALTGLLLAATVQWAALSANAWVQWGLVSISGWLLALTLARDTADQLRGQAATACLVWFSVADFLWLLGLILLNQVLPITDLTTITDAALLNSLSEGEHAICVSALSLLMAGLLLRCGMYPLMSWVSPIARSSRDAGWIIAFGLGAGMMQMLRWAPLLTALTETRWLLAGLGGLSAILLAVIAWGQARMPARVTYVAASQFALIWTGMGLEPAWMSAWTALWLSLSWTLSLTVLTLPFRSFQPRSSLLAGIVLFLLIAVSCVGLLGQEQVFSSIDHHPGLPSSNRWLLLAGGMFSLLLTARLLFGELLRNAASSSDGETRPVPVAGVSSFGWLILAFLSMLVLGGIFLAPRWISVVDQVQLQRPDFGILLMLIGLVAARIWPEREAADRWESLRRLARSEFYVPGMVNALIVFPVRAASQISRFLEWIVFGNLTLQLPAVCLQGIAQRASEADEDSNEPDRMWQMASAVAVMLSGVALGMLL